ncbi:LPS translocon maturation chaperone LptM [Burkholderia pseudomultivorans]|uniref:Putative lipoprotein n=1 Tax=Burkholderia pseudomultivorans TaxID=1207504 RepID=A0A132E7T4_9BURK|nr:lipoprotein [Burkholderia pseudomultivorans]KWF20443.1 hypothetical protein WT56_02340 [Burkholderia pseudomultivorans]MDR8729934.1 hypothetical protein [Burkholderia pseudomultivorans]MDR8736246.1 hypothetical protein [Burkholderia pseudomultivorans]MDR8742506.1 hypothetical protein [Burkholderia pseudomultivorans]MDR8756913.1 hypothetical protein [Burkholderia pseudomultivorans]
MRVVFRMSAIVAALAILAGCGQRGPLYLPTVPPLPQKPIQQQDTPPSDVTPTDENASDDSTSGSSLTLSPELSGGAGKAPAPASSPSAQ